MAKAWYQGVAGVARKITKPYRGVAGVAREVTNGYRGVSGVAREFFTRFPYWIFDTGVYSSTCTINSGIARIDDAGNLEISLDCTNEVTSDGGGYSSCTLVDNFSAGDTLTLRWSSSSATSATYNDRKLVFKDADGRYLNDASTFGTVLSTGESGEYTTEIPEGAKTVSFILVDGRMGTHASTWIINSLVIGGKTYI